MKEQLFEIQENHDNGFLTDNEFKGQILSVITQYATSDDLDEMISSLLEN